MEAINHTESHQIEFSKIKSDTISKKLTDICFGELSREEINKVLTLAGVPLGPPKKLPFSTGGRPKARTLSKSSGSANKPTAVASSQVNPARHNQNQFSSNNSIPSSPIDDTVRKSEVTADHIAKPAAPPKEKPKSWADLLQPVKTQPSITGRAKAQLSSNQVPSSASDSASHVIPTMKFTGISNIVSDYQPIFDWTLLEPRGLINNVNTCFVNVILQPLVHCPPFYNLIKTIGHHVAHSFNSKTPLLDSLIEFVNEFKIGSDDRKSEELYGEPFAPEYVYDALRGRKRFETMKGRQEDAEEFLCFLLDGLHEEMIAVQDKDVSKMETIHESEEVSTNDIDGWFEVGPKNRTSTVRTMKILESPISKIFGGKIRSILKSTGAKDSVTSEPFQSLPLDITPEHVRSVEEALENMTMPEIMHDYVSTKGVSIDATKQVFLEKLPPVLVLHVKRFVYDNIGGVQKLQKHIRYDLELDIKPEWISAPKKPTRPVKYKLFGVVYHHGVSAGGGHYTCDIRRQNNEWLHLDDTTITEIPEANVIMDDRANKYNHFTGDQNAYILFYIRS
ncbi:hypothetical protein Unana1_03864 [Umbelopsis nana]